MNRFAQIVYNIVAKKKRPETMFEALKFDVLDEVKEFLSGKMNAMLDTLKASVGKDLASKGWKLTEPIHASQSQFRGHPYISTFKILLEKSSVKDPAAVESFLKAKYSPKFHYKGLTKEGVHEFNTR